MYMIMKVINYG